MEEKGYCGCDKYGFARVENDPIKICD